MKNLKKSIKLICMRNSADKTDAEQTGNEFPSSGAAAAEQTGNSVPSSGAAAAKQTGSEFPSYGGVSAKQTGWLSAFTLAETLIALTIIGVIAAITVPALIQRTNKQEYVSALQKTYSTLSQAANMIIAEEGSPKKDENGETWLKDHESFYNMFKKYLINAKDCGTGTGCFEHTSMQGYKFLSGLGTEGRWDIGNRPRLILSDGTQLMFVFRTSACTHDGASSKNTCAQIYADLNGGKKPNQWGRDLFLFALKENGLYPAGCDYDYISSCNPNASGTYTKQGYGCACRVLKEGAMNY